jgi:dihydroxy-acid dehydratase
MGTASTMNSLAEALGMQLPGSAAIPAPYRERGQMAYATGKRIVDMVREDLKPSDIMTREAFENVIVTNSALGGSTNAPIHIVAVAKHIGVELDNDDWQTLGHHVPLLTNLQPAGTYLGEDFHRAGGVPAVVAELLKANLLPHPGALTVNGRSIGENCANHASENADVIRPVTNSLMKDAGFLNLKGNLFDSAIMKTSVISDAFRARYLSNPDDMEAFEGRAIVFDGPEYYNKMIDDPSLGIDDNSILVMRGTGPLGYPGGAEVVNMRPPSYLLKKGVAALPCIGDGRQSGTSASPSILNASPEAAAGGGLALLRNGDRIRIDLGKSRVDALVPKDEWDKRAQDLAASGGYPIPASQTPWQKYFRELAEPFSEGMVLRGADEFQRVAQKSVPRDNH